MQTRVLRRAIALAATVLLLSTVVAYAETVTADGDVVTPGIQGTVDLGTTTPGSDVRFDVNFVLACTGTSHIDSGQMVRLTPGTITVPVGGSFGVGSLLFSPGAGWPADGEACPAGLAPVTSPPLHVIVTAPGDPGLDYRYSFTWNRSLMPSNASDTGVFSGTTTLVFLLDVADNTPPALNLPADSTVEGSTTGGAPAAYTVSASDAEDAVAPVPTCAPTVGALLPLGVNTINCSVTDSGGLETTGSFKITVADTTDPTLVNMPSDRTIVTGNPAGATLTYTSPTATDVVDPSPAVDCQPESGSVVPLGTTTVTCTATDASGNQKSGSFRVGVTFVPPVTWTAIWGEPVASDGPFVVSSGRSIPVKVEIFANGVEQRSGRALLTVTPCGTTGGGLVLVLSRDGGRWNGKLDASTLPGPGCYTATASLDGHDAGSFRIDNRGGSSAAQPSHKPVLHKLISRMLRGHRRMC